MRAWLSILIVTACGHGAGDTSVDAAGGDDAVDAAVDAPLRAGPHGMFALLNKSQLSTTYPRTVATLLCRGFGDPIASCQAKGAGFDTNAGVTMQVQWNDLQPTGSDSLDVSSITSLVHDWRAAGKIVNIVVQATPYTGTTGFVPAWYATPATIASIVQTGTDIAITTTAPMTFFVGDVAGQSIQIAGTNTALDGIYPITMLAGSTLHATGAAANAGVSAAIGTVGNPMYAAPCATAPMPVQWGGNFIAAWHQLMTLVKAQLDDGSLGYIRFGLGIGGENSPSRNLSADCKTQLHDLGFTDDTTWPAPDSQAWQDQIAARWVDYQKAMVTFEHGLGFATQLSFSLSPIEYLPTIDATTPDHTAAAAVAAGLAIGNQGWRSTDEATAAAGEHCTGDWCALFATYAGQVPLELQPTMRSDPSGAPPTGSLVPMLSFALARHAQILELYTDDWLCTYDATAADFAACGTAGYPAAFATAAAAL